jgi:polyisoprenoid-binding protein YceI
VVSVQFQRFIRRAIASVLIVAGAMVLASAAAAQEISVQLDPARTRVQFELSSVMHTVHGDFQLKSGSLRFDPQTGVASGQLIVDATTGETGNQRRDRKMHQQVLESASHPDIIFQPQRVIGKLPSAGASPMQIEGLITIHGQAHPATAIGAVEIHGCDVSADLRFIVPYEAWGMKNPSTFLLRVSDKVEITVHAVGRLAPIAASAIAPAAPTH